uniref:CDGSH iron-sulfur domain-containing protein 3, mitochondrial n=1 Tax=Lygus hesperus TaxID=30085 RepID=A0A0A9YUN7_LYGHE
MQRVRMFTAACCPSLMRNHNFPKMFVLSKSYSSKVGKGEKKEESVLPKNLLENIHSASQQPDNGVIYDKKPFKIELDPEKTYNWCLCGQSKNQPFCDGTHKSPYLKIKLKPIRFKVAEKKDYWLCNCKQTAHRPFCDGTHKREDIQSIRSKF